jgi:hypothetical protein
VRVGLSLRDDYIHPPEITDNRGGLASLGVFGALAFTEERARFGSQHVHGGVEWHNQGATPRALERQHRRDRPKPHRVSGLVGIGFTS